MNKMSRILSIIALCGAISLTGCGSNNDPKVPETSQTPETIQKIEYNFELQNNGLYKDIDKVKVETPDYEQWEFKNDEILEWLTEDNNYDTVDDMIKNSAKSWLLQNGFGKVAEIGNNNSVTINYKAFDGEKAIEDVAGTDYAVLYVDDSTDEMIKSLAGRKIGDKYKIKYKLPENHALFPNKEVDMEIEIVYAQITNPLTDEVIRENEKVFQDYLKVDTEIKTVDAFLALYQEQLASNSHKAYLESLLENVDCEVPEKYVNSEVERLKKRLETLGTDYDTYKLALSLTDEDIKKDCEKIARRNMLCMKLAEQLDISFTEDDLYKVYGEKDSEGYKQVIMLFGQEYLLKNMIVDAVEEKLLESISK